MWEVTGKGCVCSAWDCESHCRGERLVAFIPCCQLYFKAMSLAPPPSSRSEHPPPQHTHNPRLCPWGFCWLSICTGQFGSVCCSHQAAPTYCQGQGLMDSWWALELPLLLLRTLPLGLHLGINISAALPCCLLIQCSCVLVFLRPTRVSSSHPTLEGV